MPENIFAEHILKLSESSYQGVKAGTRKVHILMNLQNESQEEMEKIKKHIIEDGYYAGMKINYQMLKYLHKKYGIKLPENRFAQKVLEINPKSYNSLKNKGANAVIFRSRIHQVNSDEIKRIKEELKAQGYVGKKINYAGFQGLYNTYGRHMSEFVFAQQVLDLSYSNYTNIKNNSNKRATILNSLIPKKKSLQDISIDEINRIKELLKQRGYAKSSINYEKLKELHQTYASQMSERDFAKIVLEISDRQYNHVRFNGNNAIILKDIQSNISFEEIMQIQSNMRNDGYENNSITYKILKELHQKYGRQMTERQFATDVLGLSYSFYDEIVSGRKQKATILRSRQNSSLTDEEIKQLLIMNNWAGKEISYSELQLLHQSYGNHMLEREFAINILEIIYSQYMKFIHSDKKIKILINTVKLIEQEKIKKIKEELKTQGYVGKKINYEEFQTLFKKYGNQMTEKVFAERVLEITENQYKQMKKGISKSIILKSLIERINQKEIDEIKEKLINLGYFRKKINYDELKILHQQYGSQMSEHQFAQYVLGISIDLLNRLKRLPNAKVRILKNYTIPISEEEIETIKDFLEKKGYGGKMISYIELQNLHQRYCAQIREEDFARYVLEIPYYNYDRIKQYSTSQTKILSSNIKTDLLHDLFFRDSRWYTIEEIEQICSENQLSIDKLLRQIISNGIGLFNEDYKRVLNEKGRIWVGRTKLSNEYIEQKFEIITKKAKIALRNIKTRYNITYNSEDDDITQNAILWLIENSGEIEQNFMAYPDVMEQRIFYTLRRYIMFEFINQSRIKVKTLSLNQRLTPGQKRDKAEQGSERIGFIPGGNNAEDEVVKRMEQKKLNEMLRGEDLAVRCIREMKKQIEEGLSRREVLSNISEQFGLSTKELLKLMQEYLINNGKVTIKETRHI